jgi:glucan phosphoethanolaminetransferase (alkaline phosphatase superfamily)
MFVIFSINSRVRNSFYQHYPFSVLYNLNEYKNLNVNKKSVRINPDSTLRFKTKDSLTIVLLIGESLRADHLFINGYKRNTNPCLSKVKNIVSFNRIYSEYTYTNPSVAHMLTRSDSVNKNRAQTETSFIPIFKSVGFFTAWIANQDAANTYVEFMNECDTLIYANPDKSVYSYSKWIDGDLLPIYQKILNRSEKNKLIILHTIGSHWYYNNHYTKDFEFFMPITKSKIISQNSHEEIINSYDNSVLYTDAFIDKIISKLQNINAIMIYLSDHGESLGEKGNWLHASENEYLKNPACLVWCSNIYIRKYPSKFEALKYNKSKRFRTDFLFHSILSGGNIPSKVISRDLDIFAINK